MVLWFRTGSATRRYAVQIPAWPKPRILDILKFPKKEKRTTLRRTEPRRVTQPFYAILRSLSREISQTLKSTRLFIFGKGVSYVVTGEKAKKIMSTTYF